jgi:hypothetical protein
LIDVLPCTTELRVWTVACVAVFDVCNDAIVELNPATAVTSAVVLDSCSSAPTRVVRPEVAVSDAVWKANSKGSSVAACFTASTTAVLPERVSTLLRRSEAKPS